jgi:hypothetical protein
MVEVSVGRVCELEGSEANVVESLIVNAVDLVRVLQELMDGEDGVVGLNDRVRDLWNKTERCW